MTTDQWFRVAAAILLGSALSVSGYFRSKAARDGGTIERSAEGKVAILARTLVAVPLLVAILVYVGRPTWLEWSRIGLPPEVRWTALGLGVLAVIAAVWTLASIGSNISPTVLTREGQRLVKRGPYRWIRHPLYASGILLLTSIAVMSESVVIMAWVTIAMGAVVGLVIPREERELVERFGSDYEDYRRRTGAIVPLPKPSE